MATAVFATSLLIVAYVLVGYPILLAILSRRAEKPLRKQWIPRSVSVLLPVRNGERWIGQKLESLLALDYPKDLLEILVIDDGSTDSTGQRAKEFAARGVQLIVQPQGGKAAALNAGLERAGGEILFYTDVRQTLQADSLRHLVSCLADPTVGVVSGELVIREGETDQEAHIGMYWRYEKWIRQRLSRLDSVLGATGSIYAMRRELAVDLPHDTLLDDVYLPLVAFFRGYRVIFEPKAKAFDYPTLLRSEFRRKVRTQAGVYQIMLAFPALLFPANRMWIHFVSHKLGRLLLPHAMMVMLVASFGLPQPWWLWALVGQASLYGLAAFDRLIPERWMLKRLSSLARTYVVLLAAAWFATAFLFVGGRKLWKETEVQPVVSNQ